MRTLSYVLAFGVLIGGVPTLSGDDAQKKKPDPKKVKQLMRRKLESSQKILEGITLNNPELIAKYADELLKISKEAEWQVFKTKQYDVFSNSFRESVTKVGAAAKDKNVDSASLAYLGLTLDCFNCHRYVRDIGMARTDEDSQ